MQTKVNSAIIASRQYPVFRNYNRLPPLIHVCATAPQECEPMRNPRHKTLDHKTHNLDFVHR